MRNCTKIDYKIVKGKKKRAQGLFYDSLVENIPVKL